VERKEDPSAGAQSGYKYEIVYELFSNLLRMQKKLLRVIHKSEVSLSPPFPPSLH
jgi:hypothetical protein